MSKQFCGFYVHFAFDLNWFWFFFFLVCSNRSTNRQRTGGHRHSADSISGRRFRQECYETRADATAHEMFLGFPTQRGPVPNSSHRLQVRFRVALFQLIELIWLIVSVFCRRFRLDHGWRRLDFSSVSRMDRHIEMMMAIEKVLIQTKCLVQPIIYIMPDVEKGICGKS